MKYSTVAPLVMWEDGIYVEQAMRVRRELVLRSVRCEVNGCRVRDRLCGKPSREVSSPIPLVNRMTGVFGDDFSFNITASDYAEAEPESKSIFPDFQKYLYGREGNGEDGISFQRGRAGSQHRLRSIRCTDRRMLDGMAS